MYIRIARFILKAYPFSRGSSFLEKVLFSWYRFPERKDIIFKYGVFKDAPTSKWPKGYGDLLIHGELDKCETETWKTFIKKGDTVVDVGANYGYFTLLAAYLVGGKGKVISIEPITKTRSALLVNINNSKYKNIKVIKEAMSDKNGEVTFNIFDNDPFGGNSSFSAVPGKVTEFTEVIKTRKLIEIIKEENIIPKLIKIDVEGADLLVLKGMEEYLRQYNPILTVEYNVQACIGLGYHPKEIISYLTKYGYKPYLATKKGLESFAINNSITEAEWIPMIWFLKNYND